MNNEVVINGVVYVPKGDPAEGDGLEYCIVRTAQAGVYAGYVASRNGTEVVVRRGRRLWYWSGAVDLSQMSRDGVGQPGKCKFPPVVETVILLGVVEILPCTAHAQASIQGVPEWKA